MKRTKPRKKLKEAHDTLGDYELAASAFDKPTCLDALIYGAIGLTGEAGEVADKVKRVVRKMPQFSAGKRLDLSRADAKGIAYELGDCLWYIMQLGTRIGYPLREIATMNIEKLSDRKMRGVIYGEGDNR